MSRNIANISSISLCVAAAASGVIFSTGFGAAFSAPLLNERVVTPIMSSRSVISVACMITPMEPVRVPSRA